MTESYRFFLRLGILLGAGRERQEQGQSHQTCRYDMFCPIDHTLLVCLNNDIQSNL
jgi:hypothetical protein